MGQMLDGTSTYDWWLVDHLDRKWDLFGDDEGNRGVTFEGIAGAENSLDVELIETASQVGQSLGGESLPALSPVLTVAINTRDHPDSWDAWTRAWSQSHNRTNRLYIASPGTRRVKHLEVVQSDGRPDPEGEPSLSGMVVQSVQMRALSGAWFGQGVQLKAGDVWTNDSDVAPRLLYLPDSAGSVGLSVGDSSWSADHTSLVAGAEVDLEPEAMMKTRRGGRVDQDGWASWRNHWNPLHVGSGETLRVDESAGLVLVVPRYLHPW